MRGSRFTITFLGLLAAVPAVFPWPADDSAVHFTDVTDAAGIRFTHNAGRSGKKWLPETMGPGCAFFDFDGDGWPDILIVNGKDAVPPPRSITTITMAPSPTSPAAAASMSSSTVSA